VSIGERSAIFPSPNRIRKVADRRDYVTHFHLHTQPLALTRPLHGS
jgi:hypothetical protein